MTMFDNLFTTLL